MASVVSRADEVTAKIFNLYDDHGHNDYIGEPVSQQSHMVQCAMLAEKEGFPDEVVLGAFLHDIGHLLGIQNSLERMGQVGTKDHEVVGEKFLKELGFPESVTSFVRGHVDAKRYLVHKEPSYYDKVFTFRSSVIDWKGGIWMSTVLTTARHRCTKLR